MKKSFMTFAAAALICSLASAKMRWEEIFHPLSVRISAAMVYDSDENRMFLTGGKDKAASFDETWEWDGKDWSMIVPASASPSTRSDFAMAYDAERERTVLFGGHHSNKIYNDTWEWDGVDWTLIEPATAHPEITDSHKLIYDAFRDRLVLFGGGSINGYCNQTWEWDGVDWREIETESAPCERVGHAMAFHEEAGVAVMFGGYDGNFLLNDTWVYDGINWTEIKPTHPAPKYRYCYGMVYDSKRERTVIFGGRADDFYKLSDTWVYDGEDWAEIETDPHPEDILTNFGFAFDKKRGVAVLNGSKSLGGGNYDFATWEFDGETWTKRIFDDPYPKFFSNNAMVYDEAREVIVLFGGVKYDEENYESAYSNDTWEYDGESWTLRTDLQHKPPKLIGHGMAYDGDRKRTVVFGGETERYVMNETWEYDGNDWKKMKPATANAYGGDYLSMSYDPTRCRTVIFGGIAGRWPPTDEMWEWDGYDWYEITDIQEKPGFRYGHATVFDIKRRNNPVLHISENMVFVAYPPDHINPQPYHKHRADSNET